MWTSSDVLYATRFVGGKRFPTKKSKYLYFLGMTVFAKLADLFVECHYVVAEHLKLELQSLKLRKSIEVLSDPPKSVTELVRVPHDGFLVLYYRALGANQEYLDWVYGYDIFLRTKRQFPSVQFVEVNGKSDIKEIYSFCDAYIRPNRHDGSPRMVMECEQLGIPVWWSRENPDEQDLRRWIENGMFNKANF